MPELTFSVSELLAQALQGKAAEAGLSVPQYLAELVEQEVGAGWPAGYFRRVYGSWQGDELVRPEDLPPEEREAFLD
jgi:hypothetical protein